MLKSDSSASLAHEPLRSLLYRYWFWGWLFRDVRDGALLVRHAALRHNVDHRRHLPVYMRRWLACVGAMAVVARVLELMSGPTAVAATFYTAAVLASCVLTVACAGWALLARESGRHSAPAAGPPCW